MNLKILLITISVTTCTTTPEQEQLRQTVNHPDNVNVVTSEDGRLRISSWDDGTGGTMRYYRNAVEYFHGGRIARASLTGENTDRYYLQILRVPRIEGLYLGVSYGRYSGCLAGITINAFLITETGLNDTLRIFIDGNDTSNAIGYEFPECEGIDPLSLLVCSPDMSIITLPGDGQCYIYRLIGDQYTKE